MTTNGTKTKRAWVTLLTRSSYLPGVITLAWSLKARQSQHQLIVLVTPSLPPSSVRALELERAHNDLLEIRHIEPLLLPNDRPTTLIAARFEDTWTKLRAFELTDYDTCVFLDADITIYKNMDDIFEIQLPSHDWIAATHACVCNLDNDSWAPSNWTRGNCPYTPQKHPEALQHGTSVPASAAPPDTYALLNGGVFLYHPSDGLWQAMYDHFINAPELSTYQFPDQDFLASFFRGRWYSLPWRYNALKTMKQWHTNIWRDGEVQGLHYIVDKPWQKRIASDSIGGHLGRDGETHKWWWDTWEDWRLSRDEELIEIMEQLIPARLTEEEDKQQCANNKTMGFPKPLKFGTPLQG